ncbi:MAG TPA: PQQ-binding-like beta-propeller repeat protein [Acidimicrobiales bacterium]|nr:PQQ-binding-like beta-propeller repeat protein [Acidimicrobiales bacterium]
MPARRAVALAALFLTLLSAAACSSGSNAQGPAPTSSSSSGSTSNPATPAPTGAAAPGGDPPWTTYQASNSRVGVGGSQPALNTPSLVRAWSNSLDGTAVYGQPLYAGGKILVATEGDHIYGLDPRSGHIDWEVSAGTPLRGVRAQAGCGNVDPLGITSTPVFDAANGTVYAVAETSSGGSRPVRHMLYGVQVDSGRVVLDEGVDPPLLPGEDPVSLLQRAGLALGNGRVYIGFGGQYGDCGKYHGWLVAAPVNGAAPSAFDVTPESTGGAIWGGGAAPSIAATGDVYVSTGNPNSGGPHPWAESVLELPPALGSTPRAAFEDRSATGDLDLASGTPVLLPGGRVFAVGKSDTGYVLSTSGLGPIGTVRGVCGSDPDGGTAFDAALDTVYVPCRDGGLQEVKLASMTVGWRSGDVNSTPILVNGMLWAAGYPSGTVEEIEPSTGRVELRASAGRRVPNFASVSAAAGLILVPTDAGMVALKGSA